MASEEAVDWRVGLSALEKFSYMLEGKYACDITFLVGEGDEQEKIDCHRFPLIAGSSVFEDLLEDKFKEQIALPDLEPSGFKAVIRYLYGGELKVQAHNVTSLMHTASMYKISYITKKCGEFLKYQITTNNVCTVLKTSIKYKEAELTKKCLQFIESNTSNVLKSSAFIELSSEALAMVVSIDDMKLTSDYVDIDSFGNISEYEVYTACVKWFDADCQRKGITVNDANKREVLGDTFYKIRFPTMTQAEFAKVSHKSELLTLGEKVVIYDHIILHGRDRTTCDCTLSFKKEPRLQLKDVTVRRFSSVSSSPSYYAKQAVDFQCDRPCLIEGASVYGGNKACKRSVSFKLLDSTGLLVTSVSDVVVDTDGSNKPNRVNFCCPEYIRGNEKYSLVSTISGSNYIFYSTDGSQSVVNDDLTVFFFDSVHGMNNNKPTSSSSVFGSANYGVILELYFKM